MSLSNLALVVAGCTALLKPGADRPVRPFEAPRGGEPEPSSGARVDQGARPFESAASGDARDSSGPAAKGVTPLAAGRGSRSEAADPRAEQRPFGEGPRPAPVPVLDPSTTRMLRLDLLVGTTWRSRTTDIVLSTSAEFGFMRGFSGSVHTAMIAATTPDSFFFGPPEVRAFDIPIGVGGLYRGRLRSRPMYGSVGLTAGVLVHRAKIDGDGVQHRVDPDFRVPLRLAWTIADVGVSLGVVGGYSVRRRSYERRGSTVWARNAFRGAVVLGLHWDRVVPRRTTSGG